MFLRGEVEGESRESKYSSGPSLNSHAVVISIATSLQQQRLKSLSSIETGQLPLVS